VVPLAHPLHASLADEDGSLLGLSSSSAAGEGGGGQSSPRSRSPATRPLSSVQALLRAGGPQTAHLSLSAASSTAAADEGVASASGGNSLRRPVDVVPSDTPRVAMPRPGQASRQASSSSLSLAAAAAATGGGGSGGAGPLSSASFVPSPPPGQAPSSFGSGLATSPRSLARRRASAIPLSSSGPSHVTAADDGAGGSSLRSQAGGGGRAHVRTSAGKRPKTATGAGPGGPAYLASSSSSGSSGTFKGGSQSHQSSPVSGSRATFLAGFTPGGAGIDSTTDGGAADDTTDNDGNDWADGRSRSTSPLTTGGGGVPDRLPSTGDLGAHFRQNDPAPPGPLAPTDDGADAQPVAIAMSARDIERRDRPAAVGEDGFDGLGLGRAADTSPDDETPVAAAAAQVGYLPSMPSPDIHPAALAQQQQQGQGSDQQQRERELESGSTSTTAAPTSVGHSVDASGRLADRRPSITTGHAGPSVLSDRPSFAAS
jgi:hypothetical protein